MPNKKKRKVRALTISPVPRIKGAKLLGKRVQVVPWHKTFRDKAWIKEGKLTGIKITEDGYPMLQIKIGTKTISRYSRGHRIRVAKKPKKRKR